MSDNQSNEITYDDLIRFAEESNLLIKDKDYPYSCPVHQRMIHRLAVFADKIINKIKSE